MECPVCQKDFNPHTGRRPKKFCSDSCKVKYFNAQKRVKENNKQENKARIEDERNADPKTTETHKLPLNEKEAVSDRELTEFASAVSLDSAFAIAAKERIAYLEKELKSPPSNPSIGKAVWFRVRESEIAQLKQKHGL